MPTFKLSDIVNDLLAKGLSPRRIRLELAAKGIRWRYGFTGVAAGRRTRHVGQRERTKNLRRLGLKTCEACGQGYLISVEGSLCLGCLEAKWTARS